MSLYTGGASNTPIENIGIWPPPHYWWEGGAAWGGMIEYSQSTGDDSYVQTLQQALTANYGPDHDFILSYRRSQTGNDDQAFWALAVMSALEYQFPDPATAPAAYLDVVTNAFNNIVGRWDQGSCGGGLKWQIYPENTYGYNYKNSISNGCAFALGARLARYTGEQKYADWAVKIYDWTKQVGLISDKFEVFDGTDDKTNCAKVSDQTQWTYNNAMFLHGSAFMFDYTKGDSTWKDRTSGFLQHAELLFFRPFDNSTDIMYEWACETGESGRHCNLDQQSFKAYLSRFMAKTALMAPFTKDAIMKLLKASALGAAKSCSGGPNGVTCGSKWYTGSWDGTSGVGQQLSALEVTQALLMLKQGIMPVKANEAQPKPPASSTPSVSSKVAVSASPETSSASINTAKSSPPSQMAPNTSMPQFSSSSSSSPSSSSSFTTPAVVESPRASVSSPASELAGSKPTVPIASTSAGRPSGELSETNPTKRPCGASGSCTCTPSVTKTVYVPSSSCTPSVTTTVYVPATSQTGTVVASPVTTLIPMAPPIANGSSTSPSLPEFTGSGVNIKTCTSSVLGGMLVVFALFF